MTQFVGRLALLIVMLAGFAERATAQDYVALLIGNSNYQHEGPLDNPYNDVRRMETTLSALGYDVDVRYDLDKSGVERALQRFSRKADRAQNALIFYSGHGMAIRDVNYVIPVDASLNREADAQYEAVPLSLFSDAVSGASNLQIIIFDACRDNNFLGQRGGRQGYQAMPSVKSQIIAFSTALGTPAYDGRGSLSPYTQALTEKLAAEPNKDVRLLFSELGPRVEELIGEEQTPWVSSASFTQGHYPIGAPVRPAAPVTPQVQQTPSPATPTPTQPQVSVALNDLVDDDETGTFFAICGKASGTGEYDTAFSNVSLADAVKRAARKWPSCPYLETATYGECVGVSRSPKGAWGWSRRTSLAKARLASLEQCGKHSTQCNFKEAFCTRGPLPLTATPGEASFTSPLSAPRGRFVAGCVMGGQPGASSFVFDNTSRENAEAKREAIWPNCPTENRMWADGGRCIALASSTSGKDWEHWSGRRRNSASAAGNAAISGCAKNGGKDCFVSDLICTSP